MHAFSHLPNSSLKAEEGELAQRTEPQSGAGRLSKSMLVPGGSFFGKTRRCFLL